MRLSLFLFLCLLFIVCPLCVATYDASLHISTVHVEHHHQHGTRRAEGISIVGGYSTDIASHPYQVGFWSDQFNVVTCGGSLLSPEWVITAAHCIGSRKVSLGSRVYVGMTHLSARDTDPHVQTAQVLRTIVHPQYSKTYLSNDIALVHLDHPIQISPYVQPISIYQPTDEMTSILSAPYTILNSLQHATLSGWGVWRSGTSVTPDSLQQVNVTIIDQDICIQEWAKVAVPIHQFNQICSWDSSPVRSHCNGDSGGPLVTGLSVQQLVGIVSGGPDTCNGNLPSVYTRVHQYVDWIFAMTGVSSAEAATPTNVPTSAKLTLPSSLQLKQDADLNSLGTP